MADTNGSKPAPAPAPAGAVVAEPEPALAPLRKVPPKMDPKKAFEGTSAVDRMKAYLKEIPSIRARLVKVIDDQEDNLKRARASVEAFDQTTARIGEIVKSWEEQNAGHHAPVAVPPAGPGADISGERVVSPSEAPTPPPEGTGPSPADRLMAAEGGEVIPDFTEPAPKPAPTFEELKPTPAPAGAVPTSPPVPPQKAVVMEGVRPVPVMSTAGPRPPGMAEPPKETSEQAALVQQIDSEINFELNVLHMCYGATRNLINRLKAGQPPDVAEFAQFGSEKRTPIELAEPQMALEVYRQVRENLRNAQAARAVPPAPKDTVSALVPGLNAALIALSREKP